MAVVLLATGCRVPLPDIVGQTATAPDTVPPGVDLDYSATAIGTEYHRLDSVLIGTAENPKGRKAFLAHFRDEELHSELAEAIDAAPAGSTIWAGVLDSNCSPATTPRLRFDPDGNGVLYAPPTGDQGECYVHYTSYAVVAVDLHE